MADLDTHTRWLKARKSFPWKRCAQVFAENGWKYGYANAYTPGVNRLQRCADDLFAACIRTEGCDPNFSSSGRFIVVIRNGEPEIVSEAVDPARYQAVGSELIGAPFFQSEVPRG